MLRLSSSNRQQGQMAFGLPYAEAYGLLRRLGLPSLAHQTIPYEVKRKLADNILALLNDDGFKNMSPQDANRNLLVLNNILGKMREFIYNCNDDIYIEVL